MAEQLRRIKRRVWRGSASQKNSVAQMSLTGGSVRSRLVDLAAYPHFRRRLKIIAAEYPHRVQGLQGWSRCWVCQRSRDIEAFDTGTKIRSIQTDDFCVMRRRLGK